MLKQTLIASAALFMAAAPAFAFGSNTFVGQLGFVGSKTTATATSGDNHTTANGGFVGGGKNVVVTGPSTAVAGSTNEVNGAGVNGGFFSNTVVLQGGAVLSDTSAKATSGDNHTTAKAGFVGGGSNVVVTGPSTSGAFSTNAVNTVISN